MAGEGGKTFLLQVDKGASTWETIAGLRSASMSLAVEGVDITHHGSNEWREFLGGAGVRSLSVSGSGVFRDDDSMDVLRSGFINRTLITCRLNDTDAGIIYSGTFLVTSLEFAGEYSAEKTFTCSLESSGEITVTG